MRTWFIAAIPYTWLVILLCTVGNTGINFVQQGVGTLFPFIQDDLEVNRAELGLLVSGMLLGATFTVAFAGWLADTVGVRKLAGVSLALLAAGAIGFSLIQSLAIGVIVALLIGVASSGASPSFSKAVMDWVPARTRGVAMGIVQTSVPITGIITASLLPFLAQTFSWRIAMVAVGVMILTAVTFFVAFYRDRPTSNPDRQLSGAVKSILHVARNRDLWMATLCGATLASLHFVFVSYLILFLKEDLEMSAVMAGFFLAISHAGSMVGRITSGLASDFLLPGRRALSLGLLSCLSVVFMVFMATLPSYLPLVGVGVLVFFVGSVIMGWPGVHLVLLGEIAGPGLTGTAIGFSIIIMHASSAIIPPLYGLVVDQTDSYALGWWLMAGLAALGILPLLFLRTKGRALLREFATDTR